MPIVLRTSIISNGISHGCILITILKNFNNARKKVYEVTKKIKWKNSFFRKDIGFRAKKLK